MTPLGQQRLLAIVGRIVQRPECWDQKYLHCESAHCVAGHAQLDIYRACGVQWRCTERALAGCWADAVDWLELDKKASEDEWLFNIKRTLAELINAAVTGRIPS